MTNLLRGLALGAASLGLALASGLPGAAFAVPDADLRKAEVALQSAPADSAKRAELAKLLYLKGSGFSGAGNASKAAEAFQAALRILEDRQSKIPDQHPVFEEVRYGLAFTYLAMGHPQHAVVILDQVVAGSPRFIRARYLLGVALLRTGSEAGMSRGSAVLAQLAKEAPGPDGSAAIHAASRYAYGLATGWAATGNAPAAVNAMHRVQDRFGPASGADAAENQAFQYGMGTFQVLAGNTPAGLAEYENLKSQNAGYRLKNGVTLGQVLSHAYYQAGLEQLSKGGEAALKGAIADFDRAEANGTGKEVDTHHGKALAYKRLNQPDKMAQELGAVLQRDPGYYKKINTGS